VLARAASNLAVSQKGKKGKKEQRKRKDYNSNTQCILLFYQVKGKGKAIPVTGREGP
jgi:hypothetical protein